MRELVTDPSVGRIIFGGARGADTEALLAALLFREGTKPELVVVVPFQVEDQPFETHEITNMADLVVELNYTREDQYDAYRKRNEWIVTNSLRIVAFSNGNMESGTGNAIRLARSMAKTVKMVKVGEWRKRTSKLKKC